MLTQGGLHVGSELVEREPHQEAGLPGPCVSSQNQPVDWRRSLVLQNVRLRGQVTIRLHSETHTQMRIIICLDGHIISIGGIHAYIQGDDEDSERGTLFCLKTLCVTPPKRYILYKCSAQVT